MKKLSLFSLFILLLLTACREDIDEVTIIEDTPTPDLIEGWQPRIVNVNGSLRGQVVDQNSQAVIDASIQLGNRSTTTDEYGYFSFQDISMNSKGAYVTVEKAGYFPGSRRFFPQADATSRVKIELIAQSFDQSFQAASGGTLSFDGVAIDFPANAIRTASGDAYTGTVRVATHYLDPTNPSTYQQMPGNLQGVDQMSEEVALKTLGMIAVELESDAGEPLNILDGQEAMLIIPVPTELQGDAPSEIPLWSFNKEYGIWVEEGSATLQNGAYLGAVSHFSFWNCDVPGDYVDLSLTLTDESGAPLVGYWVVLTSGTLGTGYGITNDGGFVSGLILAGETLTLEVRGLCGEVLYTQTIGPFDVDTDLGTLIVPSSVLDQTTITGNAVNCNGNALTNGIVLIETDNGNIVEELTNGSFSASFTTCANSSDIEVTIVDLDSLVQSDPITAIAGQDNDLGTVEVCGTAFDEYITVNVDGQVATYFPSFLTVIDSTGAGGFTIINSFGANNDIELVFGFSGLTAGDYSGQSSWLELFVDFNNGWDIQNNQLGIASFEVTEYSTEYIQGSFSDTFVNLNDPNNPVDVTVSCEFRVKL